MQLQPTDCAHARESLSAQLDDELPAFELDRLETHLLLCPDCFSWAEHVRDTTARLRGAALAEPADRFVLPRLRRGWRVSSAVAVASAAAVVATMFLGTGQQGSLASQPLPQISGYVGVTGPHYVVSRLTRLEDGMYSPVSASTVRFHHV